MTEEIEIDRPPAGTWCDPCKGMGHFCPARFYQGESAVCEACALRDVCAAIDARRKLAEYDPFPEPEPSQIGEIRHIDPSTVQLPPASPLPPIHTPTAGQYAVSSGVYTSAPVIPAPEPANPEGIRMPKKNTPPKEKKPKKAKSTPKPGHTPGHVDCPGCELNRKIAMSGPIVASDPTPAAMKLLSVPEFAERLGVSQKKVWSMIYRREVDIVRIGRSVRLPEKSIAELIRRNTIPAAAPGSQK